jgi:hypothetical protein
MPSPAPTSENNPARAQESTASGTGTGTAIPRSYRRADVNPRGSYSSTWRDVRCAPTLRFTRWSALSTVLVSHSRRSAIAS